MASTQADGNTLAERIRAAVDGGDLRLPPLPEVVTKLQILFRHEDVDLHAVERLIESDPAIVVNLLRVANSAAFGGLQEIKGLRQAMARLGTKRVSSMVTAMVHKRQFGDGTANTEVLQALWDHALVSALCARHVAVAAGVDPEAAFMAGLLHDVGKLVVLQATENLCRDEQETFSPDLLRELMSVLHAELGHRTLTEWSLAEEIAEVARDHHDPSNETGRDLLHCVRAADLMAKKLGAGLDPDPELHLLSHGPFLALELSDVKVAELMVDVEDEVGEVRALL